MRRTSVQLGCPLAMLAVLAFAAGCGGPTTSMPTPSAAVTMDDWRYVSCAEVDDGARCVIAVTLRGLGPHCASDIHGILHIFSMGSGAALADVTYTAPASILLHPNERYTLQSEPVTLARTTGTAARFEASTTPVRC